MSEQSNDAMKRIRLTWDFVFGVIIIGAIPLIAYTLVGFVGFAICGLDLSKMDTIPQKIALATFIATTFTLPVAALSFVIRWRKGHRLLPISLFWVEIALGLLSGAAFFIYLAAMWAFASIN